MLCFISELALVFSWRDGQCVGSNRGATVPYHSQSNKACVDDDGKSALTSAAQTYSNFHSCNELRQHWAKYGHGTRQSLCFPTGWMSHTHSAWFRALGMLEKQRVTLWAARAAWEELDPAQYVEVRLGGDPRSPCHWQDVFYLSVALTLMVLKASVSGTA